MVYNGGKIPRGNKSISKEKKELRLKSYSDRPALAQLANMSLVSIPATVVH